MKTFFLICLGTVAGLSAAEIVISVEKDNKTGILFSVDAPEKSSAVTIRPKNFKITAGKTYYVNHSAPSGPFRVKAVKNGVLNFACPGDIRNTLQVLDDLPNLIDSPKSLNIQKKSRFPS